MDIRTTSRSIVHAAQQLVVGSAVGLALDTVMPEPYDHDPAAAYPDPMHALLGLLEVSGQVAVGAVATGAFLTAIDDATAEESDPQFGTAFIMSYILTQPNLHQRIRLLVNYARDLVGIKRPGAISKQPSHPYNGGASVLHTPLSRYSQANRSI
jgi:hypothetical protein